MLHLIELETVVGRYSETADAKDGEHLATSIPAKLERALYEHKLKYSEQAQADDRWWFVQVKAFILDDTPLAKAPSQHQYEDDDDLTSTNVCTCFL